MESDIVKTLTSYPEISELYGSLLSDIADKSAEDIGHVVKKLRIPKSWEDVLPKGESDIFYSFGFMPAEYWIALLKARKNTATAARCFESGRVGIICAKMENNADIEFMKSNFDNSICAGFHWVDVLYYRPEYESIADSCNAWEVVIKHCPFAITNLLGKRPEYAAKFAPYEFWKFLGEDDWKFLKAKQPALLKYKK